MVCFVILHYMAIEETIACINSIDDNINGNKKIIVVDNASPNASGKKLEKIYSESETVDVLLSKCNLGFAKGNNLGYKYAVDKYNPDFIVVMNNDMEIKQCDFIQKIVESYKKYNYYILGPDIYSTKKKYHQNPQTRRLLSRKELGKKYRKFWIKSKLPVIIKIKWKLNNLMGRNKGAEDRSKTVKFIEAVVENPMLHGSCYIFSPLFINKHPIECFYPGTFMYMEAEILYYLALKNNEKMVYDPDLKIDHHEDISTDAQYKNYQKSIFSVKCLMQSTKAFMDLIDNDLNIVSQEEKINE